MATPFIRYAIGDAGSVSGTAPDSNGICYQRITELMGRTHDIIKTRSGKLLPGQFWTIMSKVVPGIDMLQVVQRDAENVDLNIVTLPDYSDSLEHKLHAELRAIAGDEIKMRVVKVDWIELTPAGKRKFVIKYNEETI
jgi:phenylacetate-CoA ligase